MFSVFTKRLPWMVVLLSYFTAGALLSGNTSLLQIGFALVTSLLVFYVAYGYNYISDIKEDSLSDKHNPIVEDPEKLRKAYSYVSLASVLVLSASFTRGWATFVLALAIIASSIAHSFPSLRLKEIKHVKPLTSSGPYFLFFLYVVSFLGTVTNTALFLALFMLLLSICGAVYRDIFDAKSDKEAGFRTYATDHSHEFIARMFARITVIQYTTIIAAIKFGLLAKPYALLALLIPLRTRFIGHVGESDFSHAGRLSLSAYVLTAIIIGVVEYGIV